MTQFCIEDACLERLEWVERQSKHAADSPGVPDFDPTAEAFAESRRVLDEYRADR